MKLGSLGFSRLNAEPSGRFCSQAQCELQRWWEDAGLPSGPGSVPLSQDPVLKWTSPGQMRGAGRGTARPTRGGQLRRVPNAAQTRPVLSRRARCCHIRVTGRAPRLGHEVTAAPTERSRAELSIQGLKWAPDPVPVCGGSEKSVLILPPGDTSDPHVRGSSRTPLQTPPCTADQLRTDWGSHDSPLRTPVTSPGCHPYF